MKIKSILFIMLLISASAPLYPQHDDDKTTENSAKYLMLSSGLNNPVYRDFATSPLYYNGTGLSVSAAFAYEKGIWAHLVELETNINMFAANAPASKYFQTYSYASLFCINAYYHCLRDIRSAGTERISLELGGAMLFTQNLRVNQNLMNAGSGLESFANLMAAGKLSFDISRTRPKTHKLLPFLDLIFQPVDRELSFQANVGLLNLNRRPGYAYVYVSEVDGVQTNPVTWVNNPYTWSLNGWRLSARIELSRYWPNGNGRKLAYHWDAVHAPGKFEAFQMASHRLQYTLIINHKRPSPVTIKFK